MVDLPSIPGGGSCQAVKALRADYLLGDAYEFLMRHFATESGKSKGQFYTPAEVSRVVAKVVCIRNATDQAQTIYDPTFGSGSLLLKAHDEATRLGLLLTSLTVRLALAEEHPRWARGPSGAAFRCWGPFQRSRRCPCLTCDGSRYAGCSPSCSLRSNRKVSITAPALIPPWNPQRIHSSITVRASGDKVHPVAAQAATSSSRLR